MCNIVLLHLLLLATSPSSSIAQRPPALLKTAPATLKVVDYTEGFADGRSAGEAYFTQHRSCGGLRVLHRKSLDARNTCLQLLTDFLRSRRTSVEAAGKTVLPTNGNVSM